jgi:hypothetical protein
LYVLTVTEVRAQSKAGAEALQEHAEAAGRQPLDNGGTLTGITDFASGAAELLGSYKLNGTPWSKSAIYALDQMTFFSIEVLAVGPVPSGQSLLDQATVSLSRLS